MKILFRILFFLSVCLPIANGQNHVDDSLKRLLEKAPLDTNRLNLLLELAETFYFSMPDSCLRYSLEARNLAKELHLTIEEIIALNSAGEASRFLGNYPESLLLQFEALKLSREIKSTADEATSLGFIGFTYAEFGEYSLALQYLFPSSVLNKQISNKIKYTFDLSNIGHVYDLLNMPDSALYYQLKATESYVGLKHGPLKSFSLTRLANAYAHKGLPDSALIIYHRALANSYVINDKVNIGKIQDKIATIYSHQEKYDSSIHYARLAYINSNFSKQRLEIMESSQLLSYVYRQLNHPDSALYYQDISTAMKDTLYGAQKFRQLQHLMLNEQQKKQQIEQEQKQYRNNVKYALLFIILGVFLLTSFLLYRHDRMQQKAKSKVEAAYRELKDTQQHLIQREKMASLGELTAGIAHEIQNPLNFVNNFSELNQELIKEIVDDRSKKPEERSDKLQDELIGNINENLEKINHHGKRADSIVKAMMEHSRKSTGIKEPIDINAMTAEYLRLAYQSYKSKEKDFSEINLNTTFDPHLPLIHVVPQDIGRVLLNVYNNAFYACAERGRLELEDRSKEDGSSVIHSPVSHLHYIPLVSVSTKKVGDKVLISIKDNGLGIPQNIVDKIFQPFFTTKPTGQGTGLGLSLAYDIIKAHGGEIKVESKVDEGNPDDFGKGEGSEFIIILPVN